MTGTIKLIHKDITIKRAVYHSVRDRQEIIRKWKDQSGFRLDICFVQIIPNTGR